MDANLSSDRFSRTLVAAAVLGGICFGYVTLSSRFLDVERTKQKPIANRSATSAPSVADESVLKWFPRDAWVRKAGKSFRDGGRYLFFDENEDQLIKVGGNSDRPGMAIKLRPVAMLWMNDDPTVSPIVATADSAQLNLSERFSLQQSTMGRIISGWLTGNVVIQGPKRLKITGQEFYVDETSMTLKSRQPVDFHWEGHSGRAEGGVEIALERDRSSGKGLTSVNAISVVTLNGPVKCDLKFDERRNREPMHVAIRAPSRFEFNLRTNVGTFFGQLGGETDAETHVTVTRFTRGEPDRLLCPELVVEFHPRIKPDTGQAERSRLELGRISARGNSRDNVRYFSPDNDVKAVMRQLDYNVGARQLDMYGSLQNGDKVSGKPKKVAITQAEHLMRVPHLRVLHSEENTVERIECLGSGFVKQNERPSAGEFGEADGLVAGVVQWTRQLSVQRLTDRETCTISIDGNARVSLPERQMKLSGETIDLTVLMSEETEGEAEAGQHSEISLNIAEAQPKKLVAKGNVIMRSPQASGELKRRLTVYFHTKEEDIDVSVVSQSRTLPSSGTPSAGSEGDHGHSAFRGREMTVQVLLPDDPKQEQSWRSVWLSGDVEVTHQGADPSEQYTAVGSTFTAENGLGDQAEISLFGNPAELLSQSGTVLGTRIDLHQADGVAEMNCPGQLRLIMDQDFDGRKLPSPVPMDVRWTDRMTVRGKVAHFVGGIRIELDDVQYSIDDEQLHDTEILTPELKVHFAEALDLSGGAARRNPDRGSASDSGTPTLEMIQCVGETIIHQESYTDGRKDGILDAEMVDLTIWPETGEFSAIGPGVIESTNTTTSGSRRTPLPGSRIRVKANMKTEINEVPFTRVKAQFIGRMEGNLNNREVQLKYSVNISYAPVEDLDEEIDLESTPADQMPEDSRILQAEEVHIMSTSGADDDGFSMVAIGNARLESRDLSGDADRITYDHAKSQIVLTAEGGRLVNGHHRPSGTGKYNELNGPWFEYNIRTRQLRARTMQLKAAE